MDKVGNSRPIQAAIVRSPGAPFEIVRLMLDEPRDDEILVRIVAVGVCHTDIVAQGGYFGYQGPAVLGHEGAGVVERVGRDIKAYRPGDRVAISFRSCGDCPQCECGLPSYCQAMPQLNYGGARPDGTTALKDDGVAVVSNFFGQSSFATHALTYERNLARVPEDFPLELAGPLGCGVQTGVGAVLLSMTCEAGSTIVIAGGGSVGLSAVMGAVIQECRTIIVIEPDGGRRAVARELGATHVIDPRGPSAIGDAVRRVLPDGAAYALDTTGRPEVIEAVLGALAPRGMLGLVGVADAGSLLPCQINRLIRYGHRVMGIIEGDSQPDTFIPELIELYRAGRLPIDKLVRTYPLAQINEAIRDQHEGRCIKPVLLTPTTN